MLSSSSNPQLSLQMNLLTLFSFLALEPLLIWLGLGVTGAALALVLANTAGMCYGLFLLASGRAAVRIERCYARPNPVMMWRILRIAIPGIIQKGIPNLTNTIFLRFMAGYGATPVAAFSLFGRQSGLLLAPAGGLSVTAPAMVGQNLGAGQPMRAARAVKLIAAATGVSGALLLGLLILFARPAYAAFTSDPETITLGVQVIGVLSLYRLLLLLSTVLDGALTGAGDTVSPMVVNFIAQILVLLPAVWLLSTVAGWGVYGIFWALVIGFGVQALLMALRFRQGRWQSQRI